MKHCTVTSSAISSQDQQVTWFLVPTLGLNVLVMCYSPHNPGQILHTPSFSLIILACHLKGGNWHGTT